MMMTEAAAMMIPGKLRSGSLWADQRGAGYIKGMENREKPLRNCTRPSTGSLGVFDATPRNSVLIMNESPMSQVNHCYTSITMGH